MTKLLLALNPHADVFSLEPNDQLHPIGVHLPFAAGSENISMAFQVPGADPILGTLQDHIAHGDYKIVQVRTLNYLLYGNALKVVKPVFLKIDTEGYEFNVLKGADDCLERVQYLLVEVGNSESHAIYDASDIYRFCRSYGFKNSRVVYACYDGPQAPAYMDVFFWKD